MNPAFLKVKKWESFQHYSRRNPPWIKLHRSLLRDQDFHKLAEWQQWQLVRLWLVAAGEDPGGWLHNDPRWLRSVIGADRPVAVQAFIDGGWLEPKTAAEHAAAASNVASTGASTTLEKPSRKQADVAPQRFTEVTEVSEASSKAVAGDPLAGLPFEQAQLAARLLLVLGDDADTHTPAVVAAFARKLPPASIAKVLESTLANDGIDNRAGYAVAALKSELVEREAAA